MTTLNFKSYQPVAIVAALAAFAGALATFAVLGSVQAASTKPSVEKRLQLLEDKEAINSLLERFYEYQENGPIESYANLFAKDGEMRLVVGTTRGGPAGFLRGRGSASGSTGGSGRTGGAAAGRAADPATAPARAAAPARSGPRVTMRHILSNAHIEVKGDAAVVTSRFTLISAGEDNRGRIGDTGRYYDNLVREKGEWKIQKRVIAMDIPVTDRNPSRD